MTQRSKPVSSPANAGAGAQKNKVKQERLAKALRQNLRRRKAAATKK